MPFDEDKRWCDGDTSWYKHNKAVLESLHHEIKMESFVGGKRYPARPISYRHVASEADHITLFRWKPMDDSPSVEHVKVLRLKKAYWYNGRLVDKAC